LETGDHSDEDLQVSKKHYTAYAQHLRKTVGKLLNIDVPKNKTQTMSIEYSFDKQNQTEHEMFHPLNNFKRPKQNKQQLKQLLESLIQ